MKKDGKITVKVEAEKNCKVVLVNVTANGAGAEVQGADTVISFEKSDEVCCEM